MRLRSDEGMMSKMSFKGLSPYLSPVLRIYLFILVVLEKAEMLVLTIYYGIPVSKETKEAGGNIFLILVAFILASILFGFVGGLMGVSTKLEIGLSFGFLLFVVIFYVVFTQVKARTKIGGPIE